MQSTNKKYKDIDKGLQSEGQAKLEEEYILLIDNTQKRYCIIWNKKY